MNNKSKNVRCPYCGYGAVIKYGNYKNTPRYFCKVCLRKFKADNSPFHMRIPTKYIVDILEMYYTGRRLVDMQLAIKNKYGYYPSKPVIYHWIRKFTKLAIDHFGKYHPETGYAWVFNATSLVVGAHEDLIYDIIDERTKFLISSRVITEYNSIGAGTVLKEAYYRTHKLPKKIIIDTQTISFDNNESINFMPVKPVISEPDDKYNIFDLLLQKRSYGLRDDGTYIIRSFRNDRALERFVAGWLIYYNFFKPNPLLNGQTPAEAARIDYKFKNWHDFITGIFRE